MTTNETERAADIEANLVDTPGDAPLEALPARPHKRWPFKTILEILPIFMALTALLTFGTTKKVSDVELLTPLSRVLGGLPWWAVLLMGAVAVVGLLGIGLATYMFSRAPVGSDDE